MQRPTHVNGAPVVDNSNTQTADPGGPALLQGIWLLGKLAHFDREVTPERRMHAKGSGVLPGGKGNGSPLIVHEASHIAQLVRVQQNSLEP
jgi:Catalase